MGSLTNFAENALLNHITTNSAYTPAATLYLALCTSDPGEAATGGSLNEVANSNNYSRKAITFGAAASRRVTQSGGVTFDQASGSWGTITHWAIVDSATYGAGNVLAYGALSESKAIVNGNTPSIASGQVYVEITASNGLSTYAANGFLDRMFRNQAFTVSANYLSLHTTTCSDSAAGTEVSGGSYARVQINNSGGASPKWEAVSSGAVQNADAAAFPEATDSWGSVVAGACFDASSAGNMLWYENDVVDQDVGTGDTVRYGAGAIDLAAA